MNVESFTSDQKASIAQWVDDGFDLNLLQKKINEVWGLRLTFMETRFLILDLGLEIKSEPQATAETNEPIAASQGESTILSSASTPPSGANKAGGKLSLSVDEVINPSFAISGKVTFPSGAYGAWFIDRDYRVGIDHAKGSSEPTEADITVFERELKQFLRNHMGGI